MEASTVYLACARAVEHTVLDEHFASNAGLLHAI